MRSFFEPQLWACIYSMRAADSCPQGPRGPAISYEILKAQASGRVAVGRLQSRADHVHNAHDVHHCNHVHGCGLPVAVEDRRGERLVLVRGAKRTGAWRPGWHRRSTQLRRRDQPALRLVDNRCACAGSSQLGAAQDSCFQMKQDPAAAPPTPTAPAPVMPAQRATAVLPRKHARGNALGRLS